MSRLELTDIPPPRHANLKVLVKFLLPDYRKTYYESRVCCHQLGLTLPKELWQEIVYWLCESRIHIISPENLSRWYDRYISDPAQHPINPVLMAMNNYQLAVTYIAFSQLTPMPLPLDLSHYDPPDYKPPKIDITYNLVSLNINENKIVIPNCGDFLMGIVKNDKIKSISFRIGQDKITYYSNQFIEYHFDKVYSHTTRQMTDILRSDETGSMKDLMKPEFVNKNHITYWKVGCLPLILKPINRFLNIESDEEIHTIELLYACVNTSILSILNNMDQIALY